MTTTEPGRARLTVYEDKLRAVLRKHGLSGFMWRTPTCYCGWYHPQGVPPEPWRDDETMKAEAVELLVDHIMSFLPKPRQRRG